MKFIPAPYRPVAIATAIVVVVVVAIILVTRQSKPDYKQADLPTQASTGVNLTQQQAQTVRDLAIRLHEDMKGLNLNITRDVEAWRQLMSLSVDMFTAVFNDFGNLYYSEGKGTLYDWVSDEWSWVDPMGIASSDTVLERLSSLNLY